MPGPETYSVLLTRQNKRDPVALAKALAAARKTPLQDQMVFAKKCWGIVAENLTQPEAEALKAALRPAGVESIACAGSLMAALPTVEEINRFEALAAAQPVLIAAAAVTITSTTTKKVKEGPSAAAKIVSTSLMLATGLPIHIGGKDRTVEKTQHHSDLVFYLDLIFQNPLRRMRVNAQNFDYSFLKERKLYQMLGNFKLLLGDLAKANPAAWNNHGTRILVEGQPIQTMGYESLADLERETRWLLTLYNLEAKT